MNKKVMKKRITVIAVMLFALCVVQLAPVRSVTAKENETKQVIVDCIKGNTMKYYKAAYATDVIPDCQWENIIGIGKKKSIKVSKDAKYYLFNFYTMKNEKASKKKFIKSLPKCGKSKDNGVTFYTGMACRLTIKKGVCVKVVQVYQS